MTMILIKVSIAVLVALMGVRAFQSGTTWDRFLGTVLFAGLLVLFLAPRLIAVGWLLAACGWYLTSQILTSARLVSRALPVLAGALVILLYTL